MRFASTIGIATLAVAATFISACGASSTSSGGEGVGAESGASGQSGSGGGSGSGQGGASGTGTGGSGTGGTGIGGTGTGGIAGAGGCGPCLRIACLPPVWLTISPDVSAGAGPIADLTVDIPGITLTCSSSGSPTACQWSCQGSYAPVDGHYTATISAPGFGTQTVEFDIENPTNCGCCGCGCGAGFQATILLRPTGEPTPGCCTSLATDTNNCGSCGNVCAVPGCIDGRCAEP